MQTSGITGRLYHFELEIFGMAYLGDPGLIELGFVYSLAIGLGVWQLIAVRRTLARMRSAAKQPASRPPDKIS